MPCYTGMHRSTYILYHSSLKKSIEMANLIKFLPFAHFIPAILFFVLGLLTAIFEQVSIRTCLFQKIIPIGSAIGMIFHKFITNL